MYAQVDLPRLKEGKNGGAFWSAFVPCPTNGTDFSDENYAECEIFLISSRCEATRGLFSVCSLFHVTASSGKAQLILNCHLIAPYLLQTSYYVHTLSDRCPRPSSGCLPKTLLPTSKQQHRSPGFQGRPAHLPNCNRRSSSDWQFPL
jgi:hypothetical protein